MLKTSVGFLIILIVTYPAIAAQPEFSGQWIDENGNCDSFKGNDHLDADSMEFTQSRVSDFEGYCEITKSSKRAGKWELDENCHYGEGDPISHRQTSLSVAGNKMVVAITMAGKPPIAPFTLSRCASNIQQ